jgi:hypothetical protein
LPVSSPPTSRTLSAMSRSDRILYACSSGNARLVHIWPDRNTGDLAQRRRWRSVYWKPRPTRAGQTYRRKLSRLLDNACHFQCAGRIQWRRRKQRQRSCWRTLIALRHKDRFNRLLMLVDGTQGVGPHRGGAGSPNYYTFFGGAGGGGGSSSVSGPIQFYLEAGGGGKQQTYPAFDYAS